MKKLKIGFIGNFRVPYTTENDRAWSFEKLGHEVIKFQEDETNISDLHNFSKIGDVLFYSHTHGWKIDHLISFFEACKINNFPTVSVHLDRFAWLNRESDLGQEATWFTEYIFMADGSPEAVKLYEKHNLNWFWLKPGVIERDCYIAPSDKSRFPHDVIFVGSRNYHKEYPFRPQLIDWLKQTYGDKFGHYGNDGLGVMRGHDLNTLYSSAKVVVGDSCFGGRPKYWSDRVTETIGRGGFLLHPACDGLNIPGLMFCDQNFEHLKKVIDYWLINDEKREKLRLEAFNFVKKNETYTARALEMLKIIFGENK